jgi:hypothetical protein
LRDVAALVDFQEIGKNFTIVGIVYFVFTLLKPPEIEFGEASKVFPQERSGLQSDFLYVEGGAGVKIFLNAVDLDPVGFDSHDAGGVGENDVDE